MPHEPEHKDLCTVISSDLTKVQRGAVEFKLTKQRPIGGQHIPGSCKQIEPMTQMDIRFAGLGAIGNKKSVSNATIRLKDFAHGG